MAASKHGKRAGILSSYLTACLGCTLFPSTNADLAKEGTLLPVFSSLSGELKRGCMKIISTVGGLLIWGFCGHAAHASLMCVPSSYPTIDQVQAAHTSCIANGTAQFSNFEFASSATGTAALAAGDVQFQILQGTVGPYLIFPSTFTVASPPTGSDVNSSFMLSYSVNAVNNMVITNFDGHLIGAAMHHGASVVSIRYCAGAPVSNCPAGQGGVLDVNSVTQIQNVNFTAGVTSLNFLVNGTIDSPDQGSSASMTSFEMGFESGLGSTVIPPSNVPEPSTLLSLFTGLLIFTVIVICRPRVLYSCAASRDVRPTAALRAE